MIYFVIDIDQHRYLWGVTVKSIKCKKQQFYILSKTFLFDLEIANGAHVDLTVGINNVNYWLYVVMDLQFISCFIGEYQASGETRH